MSEARSLRLAGWCGLVFSLLSLIVIPLVLAPPPPPTLGATGAEFAAWYAGHRVGFLVGNYLGVAAFIPGFVQLAVLVARIRARDAAGGWLAPFVLASGVFTYAVFACSLVAFQVMPFLVDPQAALVMGTLTTIWFALDGLAAVALVVAVGWAARATGALPRWFAPASWLVAAIGLLMSVGSLVDQPAWLAAGGAVNFIGFVAFFGWTAVLAVVMLRLSARAA